MVRHARKVLVAVAAACLAAVMVAPQAGANSPDSAVQFIRGQGSDATYDVMQRLDFAYNNSVGCQTASNSEKPLNSTCTPTQPGGIPTTENYDHDVAISLFPVGSSNGITILDKFGQPGVTKIDYARSSRVRKVPAEDKLAFVAFARDGLTWGNFREGPGDGTSPAKFPADGSLYNVDNLTIAQLQAIFLTPCAINSWNDIDADAPDVPIYAWTFQSGSGTRTSWDEKVGGNTEGCLPTTMKDANLTNGERIIFENDPKPVRDCATYAGGSCPTANGDPDGAGAAGTVTYQGTQLSVMPMSYSTYFAWPTAGGTIEKGLGLDLGKVEGEPVHNADGTLNADTATPFPFLRNFFNVYRKAYSSSNVPGHAYDYVSEEGWICRVADFHAINPRTNADYSDEIEAVLVATGLAPLPTTTQVVGTNSIQSRCLSQ